MRRVFFFIVRVCGSGRWNDSVFSRAGDRATRADEGGAEHTRTFGFSASFCGLDRRLESYTELDGPIKFLSLFLFTKELVTSY